MVTDRMGITRQSKNDVPDYGSLFLIKKRADKINEYGGSNIADAEKLDFITDAGYGSTCLFTNGDLYRKEITGWNKMGGATTTEEEQTSVGPGDNMESS